MNGWIDDTVKHFGRLDGAANIAGIALGDGQPTENTVRESHLPRRRLSDEMQNQSEWDKMIAVNLTGVMNALRAELRNITKPGGSIVNISSTSGLRGLANNGAYASSKFGVIGLTESAAAEYGKKGVRINAVLPSVLLLSPLILL